MVEDALSRRDACVFPRAVLRPPASARGLAILLLLLAVVLGGGVLVVGNLVATLLLMGLSLPFFLLGAWVWLRAPAGGTGLRVGLDGISAGGRLQLSRTSLRRAVVVEEDGGTMVVLQGRLFTCLIDVEHPEEGRSLVQALGMDPTGATSDFAFDSPVASHLPVWTFWAYLFLPMLLLGPIFLGAIWLSPLLMAAWYTGLLAMAIPAKLSVGLDGVLVRWLWRRRLIRFEDLQGIESDLRTIHLRLRGGSKETLSAYWTGQPWERGWYKQSSGFGSRKAYLDAVVARIREAQQAQQGADGSGASVWLARRGRGVREWVSELRGLLGSSREDFRKDSLDSEQLWATLEDRQQPSVQRAAAAAALVPSLDEVGRQRLRVAASVVVDPGLRAALDASVREDEDALVAALEVMEPQARKQK